MSEEEKSIKANEQVQYPYIATLKPSIMIHNALSLNILKPVDLNRPIKNR